MSETIVYSLIAIMATAMIYVLVWLILKLDKYRLAEQLPFRECLARFRRNGRLDTDSRHHWLNRDHELASRNVVTLRESADRVRHAIEWMHQQLLNVANTAMALGFVGTVDSMVKGASAGAAGDLTAVIGYGMMTTFFGLMVAIPGTIYHGLTSKRVGRLLEQIDEVVDALDDHLYPPEAPGKMEVAKPSSGPDGGRNADLRGSNCRTNGTPCTSGLASGKSTKHLAEHKVVSAEHVSEADTETEAAKMVRNPRFESTREA